MIKIKDQVLLNKLIELFKSDKSVEDSYKEVVDLFNITLDQKGSAAIKSRIEVLKGSIKTTSEQTYITKSIISFIQLIIYYGDLEDDDYFEEETVAPLPLGKSMPASKPEGTIKPIEKVTRTLGEAPAEVLYDLSKEEIPDGQNWDTRRRLVDSAISMGLLDLPPLPMKHANPKTGSEEQVWFHLGEKQAPEFHYYYNSTRMSDYIGYTDTLKPVSGNWVSSTSKRIETRGEKHIEKLAKRGQVDETRFRIAEDAPDNTALFALQLLQLSMPVTESFNIESSYLWEAIQFNPLNGGSISSGTVNKLREPIMIRVSVSRAFSVLCIDEIYFDADDVIPYCLRYIGTAVNKYLYNRIRRTSEDEKLKSEILSKKEEEGLINTNLNLEDLNIKITKESVSGINKLLKTLSNTGYKLKSLLSINPNKSDLFDANSNLRRAKKEFTQITQDISSKVAPDLQQEFFDFNFENRDSLIQWVSLLNGDIKSDITKVQQLLQEIPLLSESGEKVLDKVIDITLYETIVSKYQELENYLTKFLGLEFKDINMNSLKAGKIIDGKYTFDKEDEEIGKDLYNGQTISDEYRKEVLSFIGDFKELYKEYKEALDKIVTAYSNKALYKGSDELSLKLSALGLNVQKTSRSRSINMNYAAQSASNYSEYLQIISNLKLILKTKNSEVTDEQLEYLQTHAEEADEILKYMSGKYSNMKSKFKASNDFYIPDGSDVSGDLDPGMINKLIEDLEKSDNGKWKAFNWSRYTATKKSCLNDKEWIANYYNNELPLRLNYYCNNVLNNTLKNTEYIADLEVDKKDARLLANDAAINFILHTLKVSKEVLLKFLEYTEDPSKLEKFDEAKQSKLKSIISSLNEELRNSNIADTFSNCFNDSNLLSYFIPDGKGSSDKVILGANKISPTTYAAKALNKIASVQKIRNKAK